MKTSIKTYSIRFTGRKVGAIGSFEPIIAQVFSTDPDAVLLALYGHWEHIQQPEVKEIQSPFDSETLVNHVQNTSEDHRHIRLYVERIRDYLDAVAKRHAKANMEWHDDPEADDHLLFHAPSDQQFPREVRDAAILEIVSRHLDVLNENEQTANERTATV